MNICIVNLRENNPYIGGVERVSYMLGHDWLSMGHNVFFLSQYKSTINKTYTSLCKEYFLPNSDNVVSTENINFFIETLDENKIDVIVNQGSVFPNLCELCEIVRFRTGIKLITTIHYAPLCHIADIENSFFIRAKLRHSIHRWALDVLLFLRFHLLKKKNLIKKEKGILSELATYSDAIVCLSEAFLPTFQSLIGPSCISRLVAISNPAETIDMPLDAKKKKQLLYVGRLEFGLKRVDRLIGIWAKTEKLFPDWSFHVVGDGDMRSTFESMARKKGLKHIYFDGFQKPDKYYAESSIICLSSSSEGFGMVLLEALIYQCIPIAYNSFDSLSDIVINDVNGYCIPPFNEKLYLKKLHYLMNNEDERKRLAANHSVALEKFDLKVVSNKWISLFNNILK